MRVEIDPASPLTFVFAGALYPNERLQINHVSRTEIVKILPHPLGKPDIAGIHPPLRL